MHETQRDHFTHSLLPRLQRIAYRFFKKCRDWEDRCADFIARSWETYRDLAEFVDEPKLRHVLGTMRGRRSPQTPRREPCLSLSIPSVRKQAEAIPA